MAQDKPLANGTVRTGTQLPLVGATVTLTTNTDKLIVTKTTDSTGSFSLMFPANGVFKLTVSHAGFKPFVSEPFSGSKYFASIVLEQHVALLNEVVISSSKALVEQHDGNLIYNVAKSIDAQGSNALEVLKKTPGVFVDNDRAINLNGKTGPMILIDGRQTYLSGSDLIDLLKSMPSSEIKLIELTNNPGAKYDAAGAAGVINIKTLKTMLKGLNGNATLGIAYGVYVRQNQDISMAYRSNKVNIFGAYNHFIGNYSYLYGSDRVQLNNTYNSFTDDTDKRRRMGTRLGMDVDINPNHTVGMLLNGNFVFGGGITDTQTDIGGAAPARLDAINDYYFQETQRYNLNFNYKYEDTTGRIFNIDVDYGDYSKGNKNLQSNIYSAPGNIITSANLYRILNQIAISLNAVKIDWTTNVWKGKLETGTKYSRISTGNNSRFFDVIQHTDLLNDQRSNRFNFDEEILAGYMSLKRSFGKFNVQAGLRVEYSASTGVLYQRLNGVPFVQNTNREQFNLFPSFNVAVKPSVAHSWVLNYARRIDRPAYQDLNPFIYLLDELSYWQGNPFLRPQLSHRAGLQYAYKSSTIVNLNYVFSDNYSATITDTVDLDKIAIIPQNLGTQQHISLSLTQTIQPTSWWNLTLNGTVYQVLNNMDLPQYKNLDLKQLAARTNLVQTFKLPQKFTAELTAIYNTGRLLGANEFSRRTSQVDIGIQRLLLKDRATIRLVMNDLYKGNRANSSQAFEGFFLRNYSYYETRQIRLNFSYRFADSKLKGPRSRTSALESEQGRIK